MTRFLRKRCLSNELCFKTLVITPNTTSKDVFKLLKQEFQVCFEKKALQHKKNKHLLIFLDNLNLVDCSKKSPQGCVYELLRQLCDQQELFFKRKRVSVQNLTFLAASSSSFNQLKNYSILRHFFNFPMPNVNFTCILG